MVRSAKRGFYELLAGVLLLSTRLPVIAHPGSHIVEREIPVSDDNGPTNGQLCGIQNNDARCDDGWCCGPDGICGQGGYYCAGPASQFQFSTASDANTVPAGPATDNIPRPRFGHVPYGSIITSCYDPGVVALTFDDGPHQYTEELLDYLKRMKVNATFFVTGGSGGKGSIGDPGNQYHNDISRMLAEGHQIASHTWTHQDLSLIGHEHRVQQITKNERAIANNIGLVPTYIRPPYLSCDDACQDDLAALGYHIVNIDLDTNDWMMDYTAAVNYYDVGMNKDPETHGWNVLAHDIHAYTVRQLVPYMVEKLFARGYKPVTIGECLHDDPKNWYRHPVTGEAAGPARARGVLPVKSGSPSSTAASCQPTGVVRDDGRCGKDFQGAVCGKGLCCSEWGWCNAEVGCGSGCQVGFGACDNHFYPCVSSTGSMSSTRPTSTVSVANCQPTGTVRTDGRCGKDYQGAVCGKGYCCSEYGWCDNTASFCGTGCQVGYGLCSGHVYSCPASSSLVSSTQSSSMATSTSLSVSFSSSAHSSLVSSQVSSSYASSSLSAWSSKASSSAYSSLVSSQAPSSYASSSLSASSSQASSAIVASSSASIVFSSSSHSPSASSSVVPSLIISASVISSSVISSSVISSSVISSSVISSSVISSSVISSSVISSSPASSSLMPSSVIASSVALISSTSSSKYESSTASSSLSSSLSSLGYSSSIINSSPAQSSSSSSALLSSSVPSSSVYYSSSASSPASSVVSSAASSAASSASSSGSSSATPSGASILVMSSSHGSAASTLSSVKASSSSYSTGISISDRASSSAFSSDISSQKSSSVVSSVISSSGVSSPAKSSSVLPVASSSVASLQSSAYSSAYIQISAQSSSLIRSSSRISAVVASSSARSSSAQISSQPLASSLSSKASQSIIQSSALLSSNSKLVSSTLKASSASASSVATAKSSAVSSARSVRPKASSARLPSAKASSARSSTAKASVNASSAVQASARPSPSPQPNYSPDGSCGARSGYVCPSGRCCSQYGWCGISKDYCGSGCQTQFGGCAAASEPVASGKISTDYTCGGSDGLSCPSSYCCSQYGWCGLSSDYCQSGCQKRFGKCW